MDDWSLLPRRNAESEPAPNHPSPMTHTTRCLPDSPARVKRPPPAPITHAQASPRLTRPGSTGHQATNPGQSPKTPTSPGVTATPLRAPARTTTTPKRTLDTSRPFMDDIGAFARVVWVG